MSKPILILALSLSMLAACREAPSEPVAVDPPAPAPVAQAPAPLPPPPVEAPAPIPPPPTTGFASFDAEASKLIAATGCQTGKTMRDAGFPALWGCIGGQAETVKLFINEAEGAPGKVGNFKFMWNDWTNDIGYGLHADKALADRWVKAVAEIYASGQEADILKAFASKQNKVITADEFVLTYTYDQGPSIGERLIVVTQR